jgi:hypothetical protein
LLPTQTYIQRLKKIFIRFHINKQLIYSPDSSVPDLIERIDFELKAGSPVLAHQVVTTTTSLRYDMFAILAKVRDKGPMPGKREGRATTESSTVRINPYAVATVLTGIQPITRRPGTDL